MVSGPNKSRCKLAVFDLDGTLKQASSPYQVVHHALGVEAAAAAVYERYQLGELDYAQWGQEEITLWRGLPVSQLLELIRQIPFLPGAQSVVASLHASGVQVALVSAGFDVHVQHCADELGIKEVYHNRLVIADGLLTGDLITTVDSHNKGQLVRELQAKFGIDPAETLVAGDTIWDIPMFAEAAVSIAVAPSDPAVGQAADLLLADGDWNRVPALVEKLRPGWWSHPGL